MVNQLATLRFELTIIAQDIETAPHGGKISQYFYVWAIAKDSR